MNKIYYKIGILSGTVSVGIGVLRAILDTVEGRGVGLTGTVIYGFFCILGLFVLSVTLASRRRAGLRFYSKLFQVLLWYIIAALELAYTGAVSTIIIFILAIALAFRYSFLRKMTVFLTAVFNLLLLIAYNFFGRVAFYYFIDEVLFLIFVYCAIYFLYTDFMRFFRKRFRRLNHELDLARAVTPFGNELKSRLATTANPDIEFTRKEYEVMVAICFYEKLTNEELSDFMNISVATVKSHLNNIYKKTGLHSRSRLIAAYKNVFVAEPD